MTANGYFDIGKIKCIKHFVVSRLQKQQKYKELYKNNLQNNNISFSFRFAHSKWDKENFTMTLRLAF